MARKIQDIDLDISQVKQLILSAKRPNNQAILAKHLAALKVQLEALAPPKIQPVQQTQNKTQKPKQTQEQTKSQTKTQNNKQTQQQTKTQEVSKKQQKKQTVSSKINQEPQKIQVTQEQSNQKGINYTPLTKYSWDQEGSKVKIFFSLDGIGNQCKADQIDVNFGKESVEVKIRDYRKQNLIFAIRKLCGQIQPQTAKYFVKTNMISLTMYKKDGKHWPQLQWKQDADKKDQKDGNAGDGLMNMMKKMYQQGDDNMKRTIAQAWTKAQDKKGGDMGGMGGMGGMGDFGGMGGMGAMADMMGGMGGMGGLGGDFGGFKPKKK